MQYDKEFANIHTKHQTIFSNGQVVVHTQAQKPPHQNTTKQTTFWRQTDLGFQKL